MNKPLAKAVLGLVAVLAIIFVTRVLPRLGTQWMSDSPDKQLEKMLVGTWDEKLSTPQGSLIEGRTVYIAGGTLNLSGTVTLGEKSVSFIASGTWAVKDGHLHYTVVTSNMPDVLPNGFHSADKIVHVTLTEFMYVDSESQRTGVAQRVR